MLNHIWLALIVVGILTAAGRDIYEATQNSYGNGMPWSVSSPLLATGAATGSDLRGDVLISSAQLRKHFPGEQAIRDISLPARFILKTDGAGMMLLTIDENAPERFRIMAEAAGSDGTLSARIQRLGDGSWSAEFEPVNMVYLKKVTNAAFEMAGTAVNIALGLIGIMALWLGVMRVAEQAGLITVLARLVRPVMIRLFPSVPSDHPAVGSMIMNISANMLGLGNAATPFGLKAMEELNKLNTKSGVATDAMVTFLALNTSCVTLIPATAIAIRAATGSSDPAAIIGSTFLASLTATVCAVLLARLFGRLRMFRWERSEAA
jgi:spore maturation protein A